MHMAHSLEPFTYCVSQGGLLIFVKKAGWVVLESDVASLDKMISSIFGLKIVPLAILWNKFGTTSKNNLAILF